MPTANILSGIAVIIDDRIGGEAKIDNIISQIERKNIPHLKYTALPSLEEIKNFQGISFLLLDWKLQAGERTDEEITDGVTMPAGITQAAVESNIEFLKKLKESCFIPVFIFTNENVDRIIQILVENGLYSTESQNYIFVKSKSDLQGRTKFFKVIHEWVEKTPSVYALKRWESEYNSAKNKLFHEFHEISPNWPKILWKIFDEDGVNKSAELGEVITRNLYTRMKPFEFEDNILRKRGMTISKDQMRKVLEGERYISDTNDSLHPDVISTGDVFKQGGDFYINIRPACDCIPRRNLAIDDIELFLLKGSKVTETQLPRKYNRQYGTFDETVSNTIVFSIAGGKTINFSFQNLYMKKWGEFKQYRIGQLLPPYITRIQQRYALYAKRQGLPRIPPEAI
ncbi:MAG: hypothetical protein E3J72_07165 [Planctomycetota bacterium]|nr:MAG: hypothetical protein E3J72_07165 [Planctomycetota bacterium]